MNSLISFKFLFLTCCLILAGTGSHLCAQWPTDFQNAGDSFFELSGKIFDRPGDSVGFPVIVDGVSNEVLLDSGDITDLNGGGGAEARFGSTGPRGKKWEARTFITNWDNQFSFDQPNLTTPLTDMFDPDLVDLTYNSEIFSVEFNLRKPVTSGLTFITGPRYISLNEDLLFTSRTTFTTPPLPGTVILDTVNRFDTSNDLVGMQIGALMNVQVSRDLLVHGFIRTGGYANFAELRTFADSTMTDEVENVFRRSTSSFVAEVGGKLYVDLIPNSLSGVVGYEATWIDNVALAPAQAQTLDPNTIFTRVTPFFQALTFGLQFRR